jgi:hypothetical protein
MRNILFTFLIIFSFSCNDDSSSPCKTDGLDGMACLTVYEPVCGCDNNTYSNSCYAEIDGVKSWTDGEC